MKRKYLFSFSYSYHKQAQNLLFSYLFYLFLTLVIFTGTYFYSQNITQELETDNERITFQADNLEYLELFLQVYERPNSEVDFNTTQKFTTSEAILKTDGYWSSFETTNFAFFYEHQVPFCNDYSIVLENIEYIQFRSGGNCIDVERKITIFD